MRDILPVTGGHNVGVLVGVNVRVGVADEGRVGVDVCIDAGVATIETNNLVSVGLGLGVALGMTVSVDAVVAVDAVDGGAVGSEAQALNKIKANRMWMA